MAGTLRTAAQRWLLPALLSLVALVSAGVLWRDAPAPADAHPEGATAPPATAPSRTPAVTQPARPMRTRSAPLSAAGAPQEVVVQSLGIDAPVVAIATEGTSLDPPDDPQVLGWWSGGAPAGAVRGTALVTGHTVHAGGGAMDDLEDIAAGDEIRVRTARGWIDYRAESVQVLDKASLARQAPDLFSQSVAGRLVLVTCEDWDGSGYRSNVVVTAAPTSA